MSITIQGYNLQGTLVSCELPTDGRKITANRQARLFADMYQLANVTTIINNNNN